MPETTKILRASPEADFGLTFQKQGIRDVPKNLRIRTFEMTLKSVGESTGDRGILGRIPADRTEFCRLNFHTG